MRWAFRRTLPPRLPQVPPALVPPTQVTPAEMTTAEAAVARLTAEFDALERCAHERLVGLFQAAGFLQAPGQSATLTELRRKLAVVPLHERLFDAVLEILCRAGFLLLRSDRFEVTETLLDADLAARIEHPEVAEAALKAQAPWLDPFLAVTHRCLPPMPSALAGRVAPTECCSPAAAARWWRRSIVTTRSPITSTRPSPRRYLRSPARPAGAGCCS